MVDYFIVPIILICLLEWRLESGRFLCICSPLLSVFSSTLRLYDNFTNYCISSYFKLFLFLSETCRCPHKFFVNWVQAPPLVMSLNNSVNGSGMSPAGLLPALLSDMIAHSCGVCHAHKRTVIIFTKEKASIHNMTSALNDHSQLNLPISMAPNVPFVREGWVFLPVVEVAGIAVLMRKPNTEAYAGQLGSSVLLLWPVICMMLALYCVFGLAVWSVVSRWILSFNWTDNTRRQFNCYLNHHGSKEHSTFTDKRKGNGNKSNGSWINEKERLIGRPGKRRKMKKSQKRKKETWLYISRGNINLVPRDSLPGVWGGKALRRKLG